jgi:RNA ligase (TIGR02306 family)
MSDFKVLIQKIFIRPHSNADALEIGNIGDPNGWQVICRKGLYKTGDLVAFISENSVVPEWVLKNYGFWNEERNKGLLAGSKGDRIKMVKLRGEPSLGICIPVVKYDTPTGYSIMTNTGEREVFEGQDVAEFLNVIKYEPPIPIHMAGEVFNAGRDVGVNYDIEDFKNFPNVLIEGEEVQITVKEHGTFCQITFLPETTYARDSLDNWIKIETASGLGYIAVSSKGLGKEGLFFKDNEANKNNIYLNTTRPLFYNIVEYFTKEGVNCATVVGEVFGAGIQKGFDYGFTKPTFNVFDIYMGLRGIGHYVDDAELDTMKTIMDINRVPVVYRGPYSFEIMDKLANAPETEFGKVKHVREGVVVKPCKERRARELGRVAMKHRSIAYMCKTTGEEIN